MTELGQGPWSWSRLPHDPPARVLPFEEERDWSAPAAASHSQLPRGRGRSYGDTGVNSGGALVESGALLRVREFDRASGVVECEAGLSVGELLRLLRPTEWFLPVSPGTRHATLGGAVAHDVHGKNHVSAGSFGCHVEALELVRSDLGRVRCSRAEHPELFAATLGGLGLTGFVRSVRLRLERVPSHHFQSEVLACDSLHAALSALERPSEHDHRVAWIDSFASGPPARRSLVFAGSHAPAGSAAPAAPRLARLRSWMPSVPATLFRPATLRGFHAAVYQLLPRLRRGRRLQSAEQFLFPNESVRSSNAHYGARGVYAYQCLLPLAEREGALPELLERVAQRSLSTILKRFGERISPGVLSFCAPGYSLALGFLNEGEPTLRLLADLDAIVARAGGRLYPAKDARMPAAMFQSSFPALERFTPHLDPRCSSNFWRRVSGASD